MQTSSADNAADGGGAMLSVDGGFLMTDGFFGLAGVVKIRERDSDLMGNAGSALDCCSKQDGLSFHGNMVGQVPKRRCCNRRGVFKVAMFSFSHA